MVLRPFFFLFVATCPLPACALLVRWARRRGRVSGLDALMLSLGWWCLHLVALALVLGFAGWYAPRALAVGAGVSHALWIGVRWPRRAEGSGGLWAASMHFLRRNRVFVFALGVYLVFQFVRVGSVPLQDYDSLLYHLPTIYESIQSGEFVVHPTLADDPLGYYPYSWEAVAGLFFMTLGAWTLQCFANVVAFAMLILGVFGVARHAGARRDAAAGVALALGTVPILLGSVVSAQVDLAFAACFFLALYLGLRFAVRGHPVFLVAMMASMGMLVGLKASGPIYCVVLVGVLLLHRGFFRRVWPLLASRWVLAGLVLCVAFGAPWYVRNLIAKGNPLGVVKLAFGPVTLFEGIRLDVYRTTLLHVWDWGSLFDWMIAADAYRSVCSVWWLILTALGLLCVAILRPPMRRSRAVPLFVAVVVACAVYLVTPYSGDNGTFRFRMSYWIGQGMRYAFPLLGLLAAGAALGFSARRWLGKVALAAGLALCVWRMVSHFNAVAFPLALIGPIIGLVALWGACLVLPRFARGVAVLVWVAVLGFSLGYATRQMDRERLRAMPDDLREVVRFVEAGRFGRIGYMHSHKTALWYGRHLAIRPMVMAESDDPAQIERRMIDAGLRVLIVGPRVAPGEAPERLPARLIDSGRFWLLLHTEVDDHTWVFGLKHAWMGGARDFPTASKEADRVGYGTFEAR